MKLPKFLGGTDATAPSVESPNERPDQVFEPTGDSDCPHLVMVPRWDRVEDMGDESKAVGYRCYACGISLSLAEAEEARRHSAIAL